MMNQVENVRKDLRFYLHLLHTCSPTLILPLVVNSLFSYKIVDDSVGKYQLSSCFKQVNYCSNMKFFILVALIAFAAADSYKAAEYKTSKYESPKYETPKYEAPKYNASKYETPKYEEVTYAPQPYSFGYDVQDKESYNDFEHNEKSDYNVVTGSYRVVLPDSRVQIVTYKADANGYTADVKYEGEAKYPEYVEPQSKADASSYSAPSYKAPESKKPAYVAPTYAAPAYTTPAYTTPAYTTPAYTTPAYKAPAAYPKY